MVEEELDEKPITKPPTRWRNWYRSTGYHLFWCDVCGRNTITHGGETVDSCCYTFPSRDTAETAAAENLAAAEPDSCGKINVEHLGAYPEGQTP